MQLLAKLRYRPFKLEDVAFSPLTMALLFAFIIGFFLPKQDKYKLELTDSWLVEKPGGVSSYADLDHNGLSEHLIAFENISGKLALKLMRHDGRLIDQFNFTGNPMPHITQEIMFTGDYNGDGFHEVFALSWLNDSIFMDIISPMNPASINRRGIYIDTIASFNEPRDCKADVIGLYDYTGDGILDVLIRTHAGFSLHPRRLYIYDIAADSLYASPYAGVVPSYLHTCDLNGDGYTELLGSTTGHGNIPPDAGLPYRDSSSWLMAFNHRLEFLFEPVEFPAYKSRLLARPLFNESDTLILGVFLNESSGPEPNTALIFNLEGKELHAQELPYGFSNTLLNPNVLTTPPYFYLIDPNNNFYSIRDDLSLQWHFQNQYGGDAIFVDVDLDDMEEVLLVNYADHQLHLLRHDFTHPVSLALPKGEGRKHWYSIRLNGAEAPELFMQQGEMCLLLSYTTNSFYPYRFLLYLFVLLPTWLLLFMLKKGFKYQLLRKQRLASEIATLQYNSLNSQLDPHFILNAMNAISLSIKQDDPDKAYHYTARFSNLFRESLQHADKVSRSLEDELTFVEDYLQLEQLRHRQLFDYNIQVSEKVNPQIQVPKMLVQIFAENAIRHGLHPLGKCGQLQITVEPGKRHILITIEDNGIGREAARARGSLGSGKGLTIMHEIMELYKKLSGINLSCEIIDLKDESGRATGTRVRLMLGEEQR